MKLMKNRLSLNRSLLNTALFSAFALTCITAVAQNPPPLVFTETPGAGGHGGLSATLGGNPYGTISDFFPGAPQDEEWLWNPPSGVSMVPGVGNLMNAEWIEPDGNGVNDVYFQTSSELFIGSDVGDGNPQVIGNDSTVANILTLLTPGGATVASGVEFIDQGDVAVPDGSSTLTLLGGALTLVGLVGRTSRK